MLRNHTARILTLSLSILCLLSACSSGGYSTQRQWDYSAGRARAAQTTPNPLNNNVPPISDISTSNETSDSSQPLNTPITKKQTNLPPVKVALLAPMSGKHEKLGQAMLNAAQLALFDLGHSNFQLIPKDTLGTPDGARNAAQAAIDEGAELILGPVFAESVRSVKPIVSAARINMIAFSTDWNLAGGNTFIMGFLPFDQVERLTQYVAANNITRIGVIAANDNYGRVVTNAFESLAQRYGIQTTEKAAFNPRSNNLAPDIKSFAHFDQRTTGQTPPPFDAVLMPVGGQQATTIANLMAQYGLPPTTVKRLGTGLMDDAGLAGEPGLNGAWFAAPSPNSRRDFERKYMATYGTSAPRLSTLAYDATALSAVLAQRGQQSGGQPQFDRNSLLNPNGFFGIDGIFRFRPDGTAERGLAILEFKNGRIVIVDDAPTTFEQTRY